MTISPTRTGLENRPSGRGKRYLRQEGSNKPLGQTLGLTIPGGDKYPVENMQGSAMLQPLVRPLRRDGRKVPGESKASIEPAEQNSQ